MLACGEDQAWAKKMMDLGCGDGDRDCGSAAVSGESGRD